MRGGLCPGRRAAMESRSRGGNCGHDRLRRLPGKMAVGLAAPLSLLGRSGLPGEPAPNSAVRLWRGPATGPRRSGCPRLSGLYKKLRRAREETAAAAVRLAPLPHPVLPPPRPAPPPPRVPPRWPPPQAAAPNPRVKERFSFLTWCRAEVGEQWRRDTPLPPPRAGPGRAKGAERRRRGAR